jgi:hypothetical protein
MQPPRRALPYMMAALLFSGPAGAEEFIEYWQRDNAFFAKMLAEPEKITREDACQLKLMFLHAGRRADHSSGYPAALVEPLWKRYAELSDAAKQSKRFQERLASCPESELVYEPGL